MPQPGHELRSMVHALNTGAMFQPQLCVFDKDGTLIDNLSHFRAWASALGRELERATGDATMVQRLNAAYGVCSETGSLSGSGPLASGTLSELRCVLDGVAGAGAGCGDGGQGSLDRGQVDDIWRGCERIASGRGEDGSIDLRPIGDIGFLFESLQANNVRIAVLTADSRERTLEELGELGVTHLVDHVSCGDDGTPTKPDPRSITHICDALGASPAQTVMVGDTTADMVAAQGAGVGLSIGVLSGAGTVAELQPHSHMTLRDVRDALGVILSCKMLHADLKCISAKAGQPRCSSIYA